MEEDHHFEKEDEDYYRVSKIYRDVKDKSTGAFVRRDLIWDNRSKVMFDPPGDTRRSDKGGSVSVPGQTARGAPARKERMGLMSGGSAAECGPPFLVIERWCAFFQFFRLHVCSIRTLLPPMRLVLSP